MKELSVYFAADLAPRPTAKMIMARCLMNRAEAIKQMEESLDRSFTKGELSVQASDTRMRRVVAS